MAMDEDKLMGHFWFLISELYEKNKFYCLFVKYAVKNI